MISELHPLVVDLDGTLIHTDMLYESALKVFRANPSFVLRVPLCLGKAALKQSIMPHNDFDPKSLPYNAELLDWLKMQRAKGHKLILCTASDQSVAHTIANYLNVFDDVIASDGITNVAGEYKADILEKKYGLKGFDYVGNSRTDISVWKRARRGVVVNASPGLTHKAAAVCEVIHSFPKRSQSLSVWRRIFRVHQWLKNLLLFVPLLAALELNNTNFWGPLLLAFIAFNLCASAVYISNDLLDLENDRLHPRKKNRPFASGLVPIGIGLFLAPILFISSLSVATVVPGHFLFYLLTYFCLSCAYTWRLKQLMLFDCFILASLYTLRIVAGAAVTTHGLTFWLLGYSLFLFLSLAFLKRYTELNLQCLQQGNAKLQGRDYDTLDASFVQTMGIVAGYTSVVLFALYLNTKEVLEMYQLPKLLWPTVPLLLFWVSWMWKQAHRGVMNDDPLVFALKDPVSLAIGVIFVVLLAIATFGFSHVS